MFDWIGDALSWVGDKISGAVSWRRLGYFRSCVGCNAGVGVQHLICSNCGIFR